MVGYKFFPPADKSQDEIWDYTHQEWGEAQADKYITGLHSHIQKLADKKLFMIGIMSILHDSMHIPVRLREDLEKITGKTE